LKEETFLQGFRTAGRPPRLPGAGTSFLVHPGFAYRGGGRSTGSSSLFTSFREETQRFPVLPNSQGIEKRNPYFPGVRRQLREFRMNQFFPVSFVRGKKSGFPGSVQMIERHLASTPYDPTHDPRRPLRRDCYPPHAQAADGGKLFPFHLTPDLQSTYVALHTLDTPPKSISFAGSFPDASRFTDALSPLFPTFRRFRRFKENNSSQ